MCACSGGVKPAPLTRTRQPGRPPRPVRRGVDPKLCDHGFHRVCQLRTSLSCRTRLPRGNNYRKELAIFIVSCAPQAGRVQRCQGPTAVRRQLFDTSNLIGPRYEESPSSGVPQCDHRLLAVVRAGWRVNHDKAVRLKKERAASPSTCRSRPRHGRFHGVLRPRTPPGAPLPGGGPDVAIAFKLSPSQPRRSLTCWPRSPQACRWGKNR